MVRSLSEIVTARIAVAVASLYFVVGLAIPLTSLLTQFESFSRFLETMFLDSTLGALKVTLFQSLTSTGLSLALGLLLGIALSLSGLKSRILDWLLGLPYAVPTIVIAFTWVLLLSQSGPLGFLKISYSLWAVILAHTVVNIPLIALIVHQSLRLCPQDEIESARSLCPSFTSTLRWYWLPRLHPTLLYAGAQVFSLCVTSFIIVMILGGGPPVETLETGIFSRIRYGSPQWDAASALALWQIALCLLPGFFVMKKLKPRRLEPSRKEIPPLGIYSILILAVCLALSLFYFFPFLSPSFARNFLHLLGNWDFGLQVLISIVDSIQLALLSTSISIVICMSVYFVGLEFPRVRSALLILGQAPAGLSILVLCLGVWFSYGDLLDPFGGQWILIAFVQSFFLLPFIIRTMASAASQTRLQLIEEARSLGASFSSTLIEVIWPQFKRPALLVLLLGLSLSLSEVAAVSFFSSDDFTPLPLLMARAISQYRFSEAEVISFLLLVIVVGLTSIQYFIRKRTDVGS